MQNTKQEQKDQIKAIREMTREITSTREKARQYLKDSGIADFLANASKQADADKRSGFLTDFPFKGNKK